MSYNTLLFLNIGGSEMMMIMFIALLLFGGKKLPELARGLGKGIREFKDATEDVKREINSQINTIEEPKQIPAPVVVASDAEVTKTEEINH